MRWKKRPGWGGGGGLGRTSEGDLAGSGRRQRAAKEWGGEARGCHGNGEGAPETDPGSRGVEERPPFLVGEAKPRVRAPPVSECRVGLWGRRKARGSSPAGAKALSERMRWGGSGGWLGAQLPWGASQVFLLHKRWETGTPSPAGKGGREWIWILEGDHVWAPKRVPQDRLRAGPGGTAPRTFPTPPALVRGTWAAVTQGGAPPPVPARPLPLPPPFFVRGWRVWGGDAPAAWRALPLVPVLA